MERPPTTPQGPIPTRPHQEDFGKGISRVFFSGIYACTRDMSVQAPYPYSVNDLLSDTRQSGSRRVSKSITRTLDFEESDTLDGLLNGNFCNKSMRGKLRKKQCLGKMANIAHPAHTRSESQLAIHFLGPFGAPPAKKVLYPFLRRAFHPGRPRGTVVVIPTPLLLSCFPSESRSEFCTLTTISNRTPRGRT